MQKYRKKGGWKRMNKVRKVIFLMRRVIMKKLVMIIEILMKFWSTKFKPNKYIVK